MTRLVVLQHLEREGPGLFAMEAARLGGPMGVADLGDPAYPWLAEEVELLGQALA